MVLDQPRFTDHGYAFVTGQAYNAASDLPGQPEEFPVAGPADDRRTEPPVPVKNGFSGPAKFVFVTEDGCINAWSSHTAVAMRTAPIIIDYSKTAHFPNAANCVFTGVALTNNAFNTDAYAKAGGNHLFAADSLGDANALYFTAGPIGEEGGLFGRLNVNGSPMARP